MNTDRQRLLNQYDHTTSLLSFVHGVHYQLMLSRGAARATFCQTMISLHRTQAGVKHVFAVQLFKSNHAETIHQFTAHFMSKIFASVGNTPMDVLYYLPILRSFGHPLVSLREFALCFRKFLLIPAEEAWIINLHSIGQGSETFKSYIHTNSQFVEGQGFVFHFTSKTSIPITNSITLDRERLYFAFNGAMQDDFYCPDFRKKQPVIQQFKTELLESETIVPTIPRKRG